MSDNPILSLVEAAGSRGKLARAMGITEQAVYIFLKQQWMPLARAKQALELFPGTAALRDIVRADLRAAMDVGAQEALLD